MREDLFWLSDAQWESVKHLLLEKHRGPRRLSDRTVISGILYVLQSGCGWRACPPEYGAYMTVFNRFNRWRRRGIWQAIAGRLALEQAGLVSGLSAASRGRRPAGGGRSDASPAPRAVSARESWPDRRVVQLQQAMACLAFYAVGAQDSGARARATLQALLAFGERSEGGEGRTSCSVYRWADVPLPAGSEARAGSAAAGEPENASSGGRVTHPGSHRWFAAD